MLISFKKALQYCSENKLFVGITYKNRTLGKVTEYYGNLYEHQNLLTKNKKYSVGQSAEFTDSDVIEMSFIDEHIHYKISDTKERIY